ncbi:MAG: endo alpha-1,4 polygalactosaminidase [Rhodobacteraceae bacterium]|nr:endo alpha-1,4 polygalactosaminidase [Paracoccaceae bacterium]
MIRAAALCLLAVCPGFAVQAGDIRAAGGYWDWQLTEPFDLSVNVRVIDLDPDGVTRAQIRALRARGVKTVCYVSVGTVENYRRDAKKFPPDVLGDVYDDWPNERFLDIRQRDVLLPLMQARFDRCKALGFDAVEPDNMDLFENDTGFDISMQDQATYMAHLAAYAHKIGLEIAQKNAPELIPHLHERFDFIILESCFYYDFCEDARPYLDAGKDVLAAEYPHKRVSEQKACAYGGRSGVKFIFKERELAAGGRAC